MSRLTEWRRGDCDAGLTLIELLIASALGLIIMSVIATAFVTGLRGAQATAETLGDSTDAQTLSDFLPQDIESVTSASGIDTTATTGTSSSTWGCSGSPVAGATNLITLQWPGDDGSSTPAYSASYRYVQSTATATGTAARWQLIRYFCTIGSAANPVVVARSLANPTTPATAPTIVTTASQVSVTLVDQNTDGTTYPFEVAGTFRKPLGTGSAVTPFVAAGQAIVISARVEDGQVSGSPDGKIDNVSIAFSGPLDPACKPGWTLSGLPAGYSADNSLTLSGDRLTGFLAIAVPAGNSYDTSNTGLGLSFTSPSPDCNLASLTGLAPRDNAPPVLVDVSTTTPGATPGLIEPNDVLQMTFSEPVLNIPSQVQITETSGLAISPDKIAIRGTGPDTGKDLTANGGAGIDTGAFDYVLPAGGPVVYSGSTTTTGGGSVISIKVVSAVSGTLARQTSAGGDFAFTPAPTLVDSSSLPPLTLTPPAPGASFRIF